MLNCKQVLARIGIYCLLSAALLPAQQPQPQSGGAAHADVIPLSGRSGQAGSVSATQSATPAGSNINTLNSSVQVQGSYQGSILGPATPPGPFTLTLEEALKRGLAYNLGAVGFEQSIRQARGERYVSLSHLMPNISAGLTETVQQTNLAALGLKFGALPGGLSFPTIVGPFNYFDLRGDVTQTVFDWTAIKNYRASRESEKATQLSSRDARDLIVLAVSGGYLQVVAAAARVDAARAQVAAAQALYQQAADRHTAGLNARIDVTRSQVELQTEQNRLTSQINDFAKQKIALARLIGLPVSQEYALSDAMAFVPLENLTLDQAITRAAQNRADLQASQAQIRAAEQIVKAAHAERLPTVSLDANYGAIGPVPSNSHGTFGVTGSLKVPIWQGGRVRGDIDQAEAALAQRKAEYEDLRQRVEADVRNAFLDLSAAAEQIRVARSNQELAQETLTQSRDRFAAGVANTVEVVQAQESVAAADQDYISSLFAHNLAKVSLARSIGEAEQTTKEFLKGK